MEFCVTSFAPSHCLSLNLAFWPLAEGYIIQIHLEIPIPKHYYTISLLCQFYLRAPSLPLLFCPCCLHCEGRRGTVNFPYIAQHSNLCKTFVSWRVVVECVIS